MTRALVVIVSVVGCAKAPPSNTEPVLLVPADGGSVTTGPGPLDAAPSPITPAPADAAVQISATEIKPLALAGPYPTLLASCKAARPCGFQELDRRTGRQLKPATTPDCDAVLDPGLDPVGNTPSSINVTTNHGRAQLTHVTPDREIRIGAVRCAMPRELRFDHSEHYVFVKRADGWWRTQDPLFTYELNNKYCGGGLYMRWNAKPSRTIAGIAMSHGCLSCGKRGNEETVLELMLRVETTGSKPIVFAPLPVGERTKRTYDYPDPDDGPECKPAQSLRTMKENWVSDDEVLLEGQTSTTGGPIEKPIENAAGSTAAAGRYRFTR